MTKLPHIYTDKNTGARVRAFEFHKEESWKDDGECVVTIPCRMDTDEIIRPGDVTGLWSKQDFGKRFK